MATRRVSLCDCPADWRSDCRYLYIGTKTQKDTPHVLCAFREEKRPQEDRIQHLDRYEVLLSDMAVQDTGFREGLDRLHDRLLVCTCPPSHPCHGDVLVSVIDAVHGKLALGKAWAGMDDTRSWKAKLALTERRQCEARLSEESVVHLRLCEWREEQQLFPPDLSVREERRAYVDGLHQALSPFGKRIACK